jgi:hypothetical protein
MNEMDPSRRRALLTIAGATVAAPTFSGPVLAAALPSATARGRFDESDPVSNLRALVKFEGSLDGRPGFTYTAGMMYRTQYGELAQPVLGYARCQVRVFRATPDGRYACAKHNWMMCTDPVTGAFVTEYRDPARGGTQPAPSFVVRNTPMVYGPDGIRWVKIRTTPARVASPLLMKWQSVGDEGWATLAHSLRTAQVDDHIGVETATTTKRFRWADLLSDSPYAECGVSDLLQVDEVPARRDASQTQLLFVGSGRRVTGPEQLPEAFVRETERRFPGMLADIPDPRRA